MRTRTVTVVTLLALGTVGLLAGAAGSAATSTKPAVLRVITERDSGKTITLAHTARAVLRLGNRWNWSAPRVRGGAVVLVAVKYESDPGFKAWDITRRAAGTAKITSSGQPNCDRCGRRARSFSVKLKLPR